MPELQVKVLKPSGARPVGMIFNRNVRLSCCSLALVGLLAGCKRTATEGEVAEQIAVRNSCHIKADGFAYPQIEYILSTFQGQRFADVTLSRADGYRECSLGPPNRTPVTYFQAEKLALTKDSPETPVDPWTERETVAIADSISCPALGQALKALQSLITTVAPPEFELLQGKVTKRSSQPLPDEFVSVHPDNVEIRVRDVPTKGDQLAEVTLRGKEGDNNFEWAKALDEALKPCWQTPRASQILSP
jgi:hypothetical protein